MSSFTAEGLLVLTTAVGFSILLAIFLWVGPTVINLTMFALEGMVR